MRHFFTAWDAVGSSYPGAPIESGQRPLALGKRDLNNIALNVDLHAGLPLKPKECMATSPGVGAITLPHVNKPTLAAGRCGPAEFSKWRGIFVREAEHHSERIEGFQTASHDDLSVDIFNKTCDEENSNGYERA